MIRVTIAVHVDDMADAGHLAAVLGLGPADALTFEIAPSATDSAGRQYRWASGLVRPEWVAGATQGLARPEWDVEPYQVNMTGAGRAQDTLVVWDGTGPEPQASPGALVAMLGLSAQDALAAMGLTPVLGA